jgi:hypothetical protein
VALLPSAGAGIDTRSFDAQLQSLRRLQTGAVASLANVQNSKGSKDPVGDQLRAKLLQLKQITSTVAMYLRPEWRNQLFARLQAMLDPEDWNDQHALPSEQSFSTFLRMIVYLHPGRRPAVGLSPNGYFIAGWTRGQDRMIVECLPNDEVRWVLSQDHEGEPESGAGRTLIHRIPDVTAAYEPERFYTDGQQILV